MEVWHRQLSHVNMKTVEHLPQALNDVKIIKPRYQLICRIRYRVGRRMGPQNRVFFDIIHMTTAYKLPYTYLKHGQLS
jgi:hypothetical protein